MELIKILFQKAQNLKSIDKLDSDLKRGQRQMELIKILFQKAQNLKSIDKLDNVISIVGKC